MKNKMKQKVKWLLLGIVMLVLAYFAFKYEFGGGRRYYYLTVGCVFVAGFSFYAFFAKDSFVKGKLIVEDVFRVPQGCVVAGFVKGRFQVNDKVVITDLNNNKIETKISGMEINHQKKVVAIDTTVGILLKGITSDQIHKGDTIENMEN